MGDFLTHARALDPEFVGAYESLARVPERSGNLSARMRALIGLAVDANVTHLDPAGVRRHIVAALVSGATRRDVIEVLECCATVSIHAMNFGVPVLVDVLQERGLLNGESGLSPHQEGLRAAFIEKRGYWNATWDRILELAPEMFEAYTDFSAQPAVIGSLSALEREFVYIAFDTSATHLYGVGLRLHLENALDLGATVGQLIEVMEIAALIGVKSVVVGAEVLRGLGESAADAEKSG